MHDITAPSELAPGGVGSLSLSLGGGCTPVVTKDPRYAVFFRLRALCLAHSLSSTPKPFPHGVHSYTRTQGLFPLSPDQLMNISAI
jgi:hypothetical protein